MSEKINIAVGSKVITQKLNAEESNLTMNTFKQKALFSALAGAGALAMAGAANAVYVNGDGLGQALVYPYYTVRAGTNTLLSVVNTTDNPKAVKVRFLEGKNSQEVLDFNLFLSPKDVWTAAVIDTGTGGAVVTGDKSCTNPKIPATGAIFRNFAYSDDSAALTTLDRTREGYVEILEMATINPASALGKDVTHVSGVPACKLVTDASVTGLTTATLSAPSGGLFGSGTLLNALGGASTGYDAVALDGWSTLRGSITRSGDILPNLGTGSSTVSVVNWNGSVYVANFLESVDAVSATMMHNQVFGEYAFTSDGVIGTDWVITMPTKNRYVNATVALDPFENAWDPVNGVSCDSVTLSSTDREEFVGVTNDDFSPLPPAAKGNALCYEANVISFGGVTSAGASFVLGSKNTVGIVPVQNAGATVATAGKEGGWLTLGFSSVFAQLASIDGSITTTASGTAASSATGSQTYFGLPVVGFAISSASYKTGNPQQNYNNSYNLKLSRSITAAAGPQPVPRGN